MPSVRASARFLGLAAVFLLWLPAGIVLLTMPRFGLPQDPEAWLTLVVTMPCGLPLALAWLALRKSGRKRTAWITAAVLAPPTVLGALNGGLLGPPGIAAATVIVSIPAWIIHAILRFRAMRRTRAMREPGLLITGRDEG